MARRAHLNPATVKAVLRGMEMHLAELDAGRARCPTCRDAAARSLVDGLRRLPEAAPPPEQPKPPALDCGFRPR